MKLFGVIFSWRPAGVSAAAPHALLEAEEHNSEQMAKKPVPSAESAVSLHAAETCCFILFVNKGIGWGGDWCNDTFIYFL